MNSKDVVAVNKMPSPRIAILGATEPDEEYTFIDGMLAGVAAYEIALEFGGSVLVGGVEGVGLHAWGGVIRLMVKRELKQATKFAAVIPRQIEIPVTGFLKPLLVPYDLPIDYPLLAAVGDVSKPEVIRAGDNMTERREILAQCADIGIVLNGTAGTLHEAQMVLMANKPLVVVKNTGGVAAAFEEAKSRKSKSRTALEGLDASLVHLTHVGQLIQTLAKLLKKE